MQDFTVDSAVRPGFVVEPGATASAPPPRIMGLGAAAASAMLSQVDPVSAAARVVTDAHAVAPLDAGELAELDTVIRDGLTRCISVFEHQLRDRPQHDDDLTASHASIVDVVALLQQVPPAVAHATYRHACGYRPLENQAHVESYFQSENFDPAPIVDDDLSSAIIIDWSSGANRSQAIPDDRPSLGRYAELRTIYDTDAFATPFGERRTLHLGIDVFVPDGRAAYSPLDGVIHSCDVRDLPGDYGGVVIIEYQTPTGVKFWMLVGHLAHGCINELTPGQPIGRGDQFATVGPRSENGGWAPHLHVQLFTDLLGQSTDLDGVARASQRDVWLSISPNPAPLIVGVDHQAVRADQA